MSGQSDVIELAKKLKALADRGVGGEKANAADKLSKYMARHGISYNDIEERVIKDRLVIYKNDVKGIVSHIIWSVRNDIKIFGSKRKRNCFIIEVTDFEFIEIEYLIDLYIRSYRADLKLFQSAFILKNDLTFTGETNNAAPKKSKEEIMKLIQMMNGITKQSRTKQIEK